VDRKGTAILPLSLLEIGRETDPEGLLKPGNRMNDASRDMCFERAWLHSLLKKSVWPRGKKARG
jgi:hypothetical protein